MRVEVGNVGVGNLIYLRKTFYGLDIYQLLDFKGGFLTHCACPE